MSSVNKDVVVLQYSIVLFLFLFVDEKSDLITSSSSSSFGDILLSTSWLDLGLQIPFYHIYKIDLPDKRLLVLEREHERGQRAGQGAPGQARPGHTDQVSIGLMTSWLVLFCLSIGRRLFGRLTQLAFTLSLLTSIGRRLQYRWYYIEDYLYCDYAGHNEMFRNWFTMQNEPCLSVLPITDLFRLQHQLS